VVSDPQAYEAYNPYAVLWWEPPVFDLPWPERRSAGLARIEAHPADTLPALVLACPGYLGDPAGSAAGDTHAVRDLLGYALDWCAREGLAGLHVLYASSPVVAGAVRDLGGSSYPITTRAVLSIRWADWDGYLRGLPSRRRRDIDRQDRRAREAGLHVRPVDVRKRFDEVVRARCTLLTHYGQRADEPAERDRLARLADAFGDRLTVFAALRGDEMAACAVCVAQCGVLNVVYAGRSDAVEDVPYAHFLATFHGPIRYAPGHGISEIDYGIGHTEGKVLRGCRLVQLYGHAIGVGDRRQGLLRQATALLSPPPGGGSATDHKNLDGLP
jgi:predicted N-acyltransferase